MTARRLKKDWQSQEMQSSALATFGKTALSRSILKFEYPGVPGSDVWLRMLGHKEIGQKSANFFRYLCYRSCESVGEREKQMNGSCRKLVKLPFSTASTEGSCRLLDMSQEVKA